MFNIFLVQSDTLDFTAVSVSSMLLGPESELASLQFRSAAPCSWDAACSCTGSVLASPLDTVQPAISNKRVFSFR